MPHSFLVGISQDCRDKSCTAFGQFQVLFEYPVDGCSGESTFDQNLTDGNTVVGGYKVFHPPDIARTSS